MERIDIPSRGTGHDSPITGVSVGVGARCVATSSYDGTLRVWDLSTSGSLTERAVGRHLRLINSVAWSPTAGLLASASADKTVTVWDYDDGLLEPRSVLSRHTDDVNSVAWMPDGRHLVCVSEDGKATAWDALSGNFLGEVSGHRAHCMMVATSASGHIATVGEDGQIIVLKPDFAVAATSARNCSIEGCAWSPDGERLAITRDDGFVDVMDPSLDVIASTKVSTSAARSVSWSPSGERLAVGSYEGGIRVLDAASLEPVGHFDHRHLWTRSIAYANSLIVAGGFGSEPLIFDTAQDRVVSEGGARLRAPNALLAVPGGLLVGTDSGEVIHHDLNGGPSQSLAQVASPVLSLARDGNSLFAGTYGGDVLRLASRAGCPPDAVGRADAPVPSLCFLTDRLVAGTYNGELVVYDPSTLQMLERRQAHEGSVKSLNRVASDVFAAASTDRTASVGTATDRAAVLHHGNLLNDVAYAGGFIATASRDRTVHIGRLVESDGRYRVRDMRVLTGADESVKCVGIVADGDRAAVLAGSYDFRVYAWDVDFSAPLDERADYRVVHTFHQAASTMCTGPAGELYIAGWDGEIIRATPVRRGNWLEITTETIVACCLHEIEEEC